MKHSACLNCNTGLSGKYCSECGQKADTHRINAKHFFWHDVVHGVWHIDKGLPYTLKETFTRPGYAARDYIAGKRVKYYNVFYLILLVLGLLLIAGHYVKAGEVFNEEVDNAHSDTARIFMKAVAANVKILLLILVPLFAFNNYLLFRKLKYNFAEHIIIAGFALLGSYILLLLTVIIAISNNEIANFLQLLTVCFIFIFPIWAYYQVTRDNYKTHGFLWRSIVALLLLFFELLLLTVISLIILS